MKIDVALAAIRARAPYSLLGRKQLTNRQGAIVGIAISQVPIKSYTQLAQLLNCSPATARKDCWRVIYATDQNSCPTCAVPYIKWGYVVHGHPTDEYYTTVEYTCPNNHKWTYTPTPSDA